MPIINTLEIYEDLKSQFKEDEARTLTKALEKSLEEYQKKQESFLATKDDITKFQIESKNDMTKLREELKEDINKVRNDLANAKAEIIKWLFIFLIGQGATIISILKFIK